MTFTVKSLVKIKTMGSGSFIGDTLRYAPATILPAIIAVTSSAVFTRLFDPRSYGLLLLVNVAIGAVVSAVSQVFGQPVGRFYAEMVEDKHSNIYSLVIARFTRWIVIGGFSTVVLVTGVVLISGIGNISPWIVVGGALGALAQTIVFTLSPILSAARDISAFRRLQIIRSLLLFALPLLLITIFKREIVLMIWGSTASFWIVAFILKTWMPKYLNMAKSQKLTADVMLRKDETTKRFLRFGIPMSLWFFSATLIDSSDRYIIGLFDGTKAVALYGTAYTITAQALALVSVPLVNAMWPRVMALWAREKDVQEVQEFLGHATDLYMMLGVALTGGTAVVGSDVVRVLLGPGYQGGAEIMAPVMAGSVLWGVSLLGHKSIEIFERNGLMMWNVAIAATANVALNLWLIPLFGWWIAAYTTIFSYTVYFCITWFFARRFIPWDIPWTKIIIYVAGAYLGWYISTKTPDVGSAIGYLDLLERGLLFCICYIIVVAGVNVGVSMLRNQLRQQ